MEANTNPTKTRRRQRRPDLQSTFDIPQDLQQLISDVAHMLKSEMKAETRRRSAVAEKVVDTTDKALHELLKPSITPAQQLHAISKITGAIKDVPKPQLGPMLTETSGGLYSWGRILALEAAVPMLLDCRVRYLHRALMTLLRVILTSLDASTEVAVRKMYVTRVLRRAIAATSAHEALPAAAAATLYFPNATNELRNGVTTSPDTVLNFLNTVDSLTSTLMPMMPSVFKDTFLEVLPLLAECFQWVVVNSTSHSCSQVGDDSNGDAAAAVPPVSLEESDGEVVLASPRENEEENNEEADQDIRNTNGTVSQAQYGSVRGTVFGEDLEHIRFCVRVVATYIHKYMDSLAFAMLSGTAGSDVSRQLARLLQPAVVMLVSPIFPKDVLNAVGLLVASILTVRTCDGWLLSTVCAALRDNITQSSITAGETGAAQAGKGLPYNAAVREAKSLAALFDCAKLTLGVVCSADPQAASQAHHGIGAKALHDLFTAFTPNSCFALLKGILAHTSSPIRGNWMSLGVLLKPRGATSTVVVYDLILPAAQRFCNMVQEPETRFMAIQTVDSVVRHVSTVLSTAATALKQSSNVAKQNSTSSPSDMAKGKEGAAALTEQARQHLSALCVSTPKLQAVLSFSTQLIMALWDDGTQQMSGAFYGTYSEILKISETLHTCRQQQSRASGDTSTVDVATAEADTAVTLEQILNVPAERRGKYHALLSHLSMTPLKHFIRVLQQHYHCEDVVSDAVAMFSRTLLSGASNHKIGNVAGDLLAQLAHAIKKTSPDTVLTNANSSGCNHTETIADVLRKGIVEPLARAMTEKNYVRVSSNVSDAVNISHIAAHFVAPLVKQDPSFLEAILSTVVNEGGASANLNEPHACERCEQGVVEVLSRARGVGIDIVPYVASGSTVFSVLEASMHSLNYEIRNSALCLCVLGTKKVQAVQPWQLWRMEEYLILNMHLGGDSTAQKSLLEMLKKWVRRLVESYTSKGVKASANNGSEKATKKQRREHLTDVTSEATSLTLSNVGTPTAMELGTPVYRHAVMQHCARLADIFAQNIGLNLRASVGLAVERRVTAMMGYTILLQGLRAVIKGESQERMWLATEKNAQQSLLYVCVVPSLIAALSDGWSQARDSAQELLQLFCELAPAAVFAEARDTNGDVAGIRSCTALIERAHQDLLKAQTYRNAEGAVQRFLLFSTRSVKSQADAQCNPQHELIRLNALLEAERSSVINKCAKMSAMRSSASYAYIQANPLHGSLSLCAELLRFMISVDRHLSPCETENDKNAAVVLTQASTQLLQCCCVVLRTCGSLVGTETVSTGATAGVGKENEVVDCRGHVYDRSRPEAESVMRGVVNNMWLGMRVSTTAVNRVLEARPVHLLPFDVVRSTAYELVHALLVTKHNGVMRCVREALKSLTAALVRSREPQFYQLPAELLEFLLGPEGVTSGDMTRMLRRSQGLPHAILAVLEAEDTAVPYYLFPIAMRQLTRVARGDIQTPESTVSYFNSLGSTLDDVRRSQRSNALNVLKFIFENKVFADRVVAHIEEAFSLATEGFHDGSWYTRNSSLMLFSAVIHRFVGEHPSTGGAGVNTSLHDVAKRTPRGVAYTYAELTRGNGLVDNIAAGNSSSCQTAGTSTTAEVNVALFPVLQLLSMLSPDPPHLITKASHSESDDTARMSEAVLRCAGSPSLMVRSASAVALCCLVPVASLARVIERTRRGLNLLPYKAEAQPDNLDTEGREQKKKSHISSDSDGGLNACHGALLQLLQFHAQYVGTLRRHYKQKCSSYATPVVTVTVCHAICEVVLSCRAILVKVCGGCPTVAAALFALLADLVYYGPQQHLPESQAHALREFCVAALKAYVLSSQDALERGSVMEGASALVVFMAAQHRTPIGAWSSSEQQCTAQILHHEAAVLAIRNGEHNLISWIAKQLLHYSDHTTGILDMASVASILQVLAGDVQCDISALVLHSLTNFFGNGTAAVPNIGCIAWGQLVTHLRFAATSMVIHSSNGASCARQTSCSNSVDNAHSCSPSTTADAVPDNAVESSSPIHQLYKMVIHLLTLAANDDVSTADGALCRNSDACSAALDLVASYDMYARASHAISLRVARTLAYYAKPEQPLESRLAVVKALRTAQPFLRRCASAVNASTSNFPESAVTLFLVLLRLLVDDTSNIREAASTICSHCVWGPQKSPRDQVSCLLAVVRLLRQLHTMGQVPSASAVAAMLAVTEIGDVAAASTDLTAANKAEVEREGERDTEDDRGDEDALFQKETANMFAEETVLLCLVGHIFGADTSQSVAAACKSFSVFDELLK